MMKMNNKGFTLIESIVAIAIITIASGMFILGFMNVTTLMSESSIIKTETNRLFEQVSIDSDEVTKNQSGTMVINGVNCQVDIHSMTSHENGMEIRLSKFTSTGTALEWLPVQSDEHNNEEITDPSKNCIDATFKVLGLNSIDNFPNDFNEITQKDWSFESVGSVQKSVIKDYPENLFDYYGNVDLYITSFPVIDSNYKPIWFAIANSYGTTNVYGILIEKDVNTLLIPKQYYGWNIVTFTNTIELPTDLDTNAIYVINGKEYTLEQLKNPENFTTETNQFYVASKK